MELSLRGMKQCATSLSKWTAILIGDKEEWKERSFWNPSQGGLPRKCLDWEGQGWGQVGEAQGGGGKLFTFLTNLMKAEAGPMCNKLCFGACVEEKGGGAPGCFSRANLIQYTKPIN